MVERRSPRGPAPAHSRSAIAVAAVRIADADGLAAVTMRRLAAEFATGGGSLYRYVASRDDLLDLMVDAVTAELDLSTPLTGRWPEDVVALGRSLLRLHRRHGWLGDVRRGASIPGPHVVDYLERGLAVLAPVAASTKAKLEAVALLTGVVTLFAQQERWGAAVPLTAPDQERWPLLGTALRTAGPDPTPSPDLFDRVVAGVVRGVLGPAA